MPSETVNADERAEESTIRVIAGHCHMQLTGATEEEQRGQVVVLLKPDNTVLVHDVDGYRPVAWLTRAETVSIDDENWIVTAVDGDQWLRIDIDRIVTDRQLPSSKAGESVGRCPSCRAPLVRAGGDVHCIGCGDRYGLPRGADLLETRCECGLPRMRVTRGDRFELCIDRECEPLQAAVADRFDGTWPCPAPGCDGRLQIIHRGGLMVACDAYPDCDTQFSMPAAPLENTCGCGLPRFRIDNRSRCLDSACADA